MDLNSDFTTNINTQENAKEIKHINKDTVHKICSGQVVINLSIAIKELVENALDAGSTSIEIRLKEYGKDLIEVIDNGSGVEEKNFSGLTLKYHTSKLREFSDLLGISTFGFRGEALSSLCAMSDLIIITRHSSVEHGTKITYDYKGHISNMSPCARQIGTTVCLSNLFNSLPVRQKEFHKNFKREFNKMVQLLNAYCLVCERVKFTCTNSTNKGSKSVIVATQGGSIRENIACVFGVKQLHSLLELNSMYPENFVNNIKEKFYSDLESITEEISFTPEEPIDVADIKSDNELDLSEESSNDASEVSLKKSNSSKSSLSLSSNSSISKSQNNKDRNNIKPFEFKGYLSSCSHGSGRSTTERQFFYINSRPCEPQKVIKVVNEVYKQYNPHQYPFIFLDVKVKRSSVDVNVTPDKRKIFLNREKLLLDILKVSLNKLYENIPSSLKIENVHTVSMSQNINLERNVDNPRVFSSFLSQFASKSSILSNNKENTEVKNELDKKPINKKVATLDTFVKTLENKDIVNENTENLLENDDTKKGIDENRYETITIEDLNLKHILEEKIEDISLKNKCSENNDDYDELSESDLKEAVYLGYTDKIPLSQVVTLSDVIDDHNQSKDNESHISKKRKQVMKNHLGSPKKIHREESGNKIVNDNRKVGVITTNLASIKSLLMDHIKNKKNKYNPITKLKFRSTINPVLNKKCEEELRKEISKDMFSQMNIIGQFNLAFIVTCFESDLFIIDQHASDEKYNFETLQKTTTLSNQKLVIPQSLNLTSVNEMLLMDNLEIFVKNGFTFEIDENAPPTQRIKLLTIPMSKNCVFGKDDIEELLFMLKDNPHELCRPSRIQLMFASRACRKSVMVGSPLSMSIMRKLVDHMGTIEHPWNCPHGRPTIRHLINFGLTDPV